METGRAWSAIKWAFTAVLGFIPLKKEMGKAQP